MNDAVDVQRKSADGRRRGWVKDHGVTDGLDKGSGTIAVGGANFTESHVLANSTPTC